MESAMALILLLRVEHGHVVLVLLLAFSLRQFQQLDIVVHLVNFGLLLCNCGGTFLLDLLKCLLIVLNQIDFKEVSFLEIE